MFFLDAFDFSVQFRILFSTRKTQLHYCNQKLWIFLCPDLENFTAQNKQIDLVHMHFFHLYCCFLLYTDKMKYCGHFGAIVFYWVDLRTLVWSAWMRFYLHTFRKTNRYIITHQCKSVYPFLCLHRRTVSRCFENCNLNLMNKLECPLNCCANADYAILKFV